MDLPFILQALYYILRIEKGYFINSFSTLTFCLQIKHMKKSKHFYSIARTELWNNTFCLARIISFEPPATLWVASPHKLGRQESWFARCCTVAGLGPLNPEYNGQEWITNSQDWKGISDNIESNLSVISLKSKQLNISSNWRLTSLQSSPRVKSWFTTLKDCLISIVTH